LKDRPKDFAGILALIDDEPVIDNAVGIFKYSSARSVFTPIPGLNVNSGESFGQDTFQPIPGTASVFILSQFCGMGCSKPVMALYNYSDGTVSNLNFPESVNSEISQPVGSAVGYQYLTISWIDVVKSELGVSYAIDGVTKYLVYDVNLKLWSDLAQVPAGVEKFDQTNGVVCNNVYSFASNGNKFSDPGCSGTAQSGNLSWKITKGVVYETDSTTKVQKALNPPVEEAYYTPFETISPPGFTSLKFVNGRLWIGSDRGLSSYNPTDGTFRLYGITQGLLSKEVTNFLVGKNIWVITNWGGLSKITE
jgi:hypothetical protein